MTIATAHPRGAETYDADPNATRDLDQRASAEILGTRRFALTIEAGCGSGKNTPLLARIGQSVLATVRAIEAWRASVVSSSKSCVRRCTTPRHALRIDT